MVTSLDFTAIQASARPSSLSTPRKTSSLTLFIPFGEEIGPIAHPALTEEPLHRSLVENSDRPENVLRSAYIRGDFESKRKERFRA